MFHACILRRRAASLRTVKLAMSLLAAAAGSWTVHVPAATTITTEPSSVGTLFPADAAVIAATPSDGDYTDRAATSLAQTIRSAGFDLETIYLEYEEGGAVELTIFTVADVGAASLAEPPPGSGTTLFSETLEFPSVTGLHVAAIQLDVPLALPANAGTDGYAIHLDTSGNTAFGWHRTGATHADVYGGGIAYENGSWKSSGARDFVLSMEAGSPAGTGTTYFVDSVFGNDTADGTSTNTPWQTLGKVNATTFAPGDRILFKAGSAWTGSLNPKGSGEPGRPIAIDRYGEGNRPLIDGNGIHGTGTTGGGAVYLYNQAYWEISNLEVVNDAPSDAERRGIHIAAANYGTVQHIHIRNCHIHNIRGFLRANSSDLISKRTGGIIVETIDDASVPTRFNDLLIESNTITTVRNEGIVATGNRIKHNDFPLTPAWNARHASNLIVRGNTISDVTRNALILRLADKTCLVEYNVCFDTATLDTGNTMFTAACNGSVFQFNEGYLNHAGPEGIRDGSLYDADLRSTDIIFQYSYSHDNAHGLFWTVPAADGPNSNIVVRYNISRNDRGNIFSLSGTAGGVASAYIYNNLVYLPPGSSNLLFDARNGTHTNYVYNNIFYIEGEDVSYDLGSDTYTFDHNVFYGQHPASEPPDAHKLTDDPMLVAPGTGGIGLETLSGYKLQDGSPAIDSGTNVANHGGLDFFGGAVPVNRVADRGAHEFMVATTTNAPVITGMVLEPGPSVVVEFLGSPGTTYHIQAATNPVAATWLNVSTNTGDTTGAWTYTDPPLARQRYYRARTP